MSSNALAIYNNFDELQSAALALQQSGYFSDVKSKAQAVVKVMAGAELGLPPFASMSGIHIIKGKPTLGSNVIATLVKNDPRYNYHIKQADNNACVLEWLEDGEVVGEAGFTIQEAKEAGLTNKDNWRKYTSDMLFARAISRGARRYAPGIFGGSPVYTPDEMGADTDEEGYIDVKVQDVTDTEADPVLRGTDEKEEEKKKKKKNFTRPLAPVDVKNQLLKKVGTRAGDSMTDKQEGLFKASFIPMFNVDQERHTFTHYIFGKESTNDLADAEKLALIDWMALEKIDGGYIPSQDAITEAKRVFNHVQEQQGQMKIELEDVDEVNPHG